MLLVCSNVKRLKYHHPLPSIKYEKRRKKTHTRTETVTQNHNKAIEAATLHIQDNNNKMKERMNTTKKN